MDATIRAAWLYYHHDLTQAEIAKQLQVSRPTVANLLARTRCLDILITDERTGRKVLALDRSTRQKSIAVVSAKSA